MSLGGAGLLLFLLTGQYMARIAGVADLPDTERILYRSSHIYLFLACCANVFAGYLMPVGRTANKLQWLCSLLLLLAPTLFAWSFFTEVSQDSLDRPVAKIALFSLFAAAVILLADACLQQVLTRGRDQT